MPLSHVAFTFAENAQTIQAFNDAARQAEVRTDDFEESWLFSAIEVEKIEFNSRRAGFSQ